MVVAGMAGLAVGGIAGAALASDSPGKFKPMNLGRGREGDRMKRIRDEDKGGKVQDEG